MSTQKQNWWIGRQGAVHTIASGMHDRTAVIERSLGPNFTTIVDETTQNCATVDQIEVLVLSGQDKYTCCLHARSPDHSQATHTPAEPALGSTAAISEAAEQYLPEFFGIETGDLWLGPLCSSMTLCDRAIATEDNWSLRDTDDPLGRIIAWAIHNNREPTIIQLLVQPTAYQSYEVTLRTMHLASHPPVRRREIGQTLYDGVNSPFVAMQTEEIGSARSLAADHWDTINVDYSDTSGSLWYPTGGDSVTKPTRWDPQFVASRGSLMSHIEARAFLTADPLTDHYEPFDVDPQLSVNKQELEHLLDLSCCGVNVSIDTIDGVSVPLFERHNQIREATGTDAAAVLASPSTTNWQTLSQEDSALEIIYRWFGLGSLTRPDVDPQYLQSRIKTAHLTNDSPLREGHVVIVDKNASRDAVAIGTAAGLINAANTAVSEYNWLWVVGVDKASSRWAAEVLRQPLQDFHESYVEPYLLPKAWTLDDGTVPLVDRSHNLRWQFMPGGDWQLIVNNVVRASGSLEELTNPPHLTLPRFVEEDTEFTYVCPEDDPHQYHSTDEIKRHLTTVNQPYPPYCPTFAGLSTVLYVDTATVRPLQDLPTWTDRASHIRTGRGYRTAAEEFVEELTIPRPTDGPYLERIRPWLTRYYRSQADYDLVAPHAYSLEDMVPAWVKYTDEGTDYIVDRSWPVPPLAVSSDLHSNDHTTN